MILHIYLITVCTYFEPGRPWADIIQEINKKSKNSNFLLFTKWLPDLDWFTAWITLGIGQCGHFRIKVQKCPEPLPRAGNSTSNWAVQNARSTSSCSKGAAGTCDPSLDPNCLILMQCSTKKLQNNRLPYLPLRECSLPPSHPAPRGKSWLRHCLLC